MRIGVKPGQYGWAFDDLVESWAVAEEAGFDVLGCFDHVSSLPDGKRAWDERDTRRRSLHEQLSCARSQTGAERLVPSTRPVDQPSGLCE